MADPAKPRATYQDLVDAPEGHKAELVNGDLVVSPRPRSSHAVAASRLGFALGPPFDRGQGGPGGWVILGEPELHLDDQVLVPDLAGWRVERMPVIPEVPAFTVAPDWICEVLSPSTTAIDRGRKLPIYAAFGVSHAWIVDPHAHLLEVFRRHQLAWILAGVHSGEDRVRAEPFDAIELDLGALWANMEPPPPTRGSRAGEPGTEYAYDYY